MLLRHDFTWRDGPNQYRSQLGLMGIRASRERIRESLRRIDPEGVERRLHEAIQRRRYNVPRAM